MRCQKCKKEIEDGSWSCPYCGEILDTTLLSVASQPETVEQPMAQETGTLELPQSQRKDQLPIYTMSEAEHKKQVRAWVIVSSALALIPLLLSILAYTLPIYGRGEGIVEHFIRLAQLDTSLVDNGYMFSMVVVAGLVLIWAAVISISKIFLAIINISGFNYIYKGFREAVFEGSKVEGAFSSLNYCWAVGAVAAVVNMICFATSQIILFSVVLLLFSIAGQVVDIIAKKKIEKLFESDCAIDG